MSVSFAYFNFLFVYCLLFLIPSQYKHLNPSHELWNYYVFEHILFLYKFNILNKSNGMKKRQNPSAKINNKADNQICQENSK